MSMETAIIRNEDIGYINELPEDKLYGASEAELLNEIEKGLEDVRQGRVRPFKEAMADIRKRASKR